MRVLLDNDTPRPVARVLQPRHSVTEARAEAWDRLSNGDLLNAAEGAGYDLLLTADKNIRYQQNLAGRKIALVVLTKPQWPLVKNHLGEIAAAVDAATPGSYAEVEIADPSQQQRELHEELTRTAERSEAEQQPEKNEPGFDLDF